MNNDDEGTKRKVNRLSPEPALSSTRHYTTIQKWIFFPLHPNFHFILKFSNDTTTTLCANNLVVADAPTTCRTAVWRLAFGSRCYIHSTA